MATNAIFPTVKSKQSKIINGDETLPIPLKTKAKRAVEKISQN